MTLSDKKVLPLLQKNFVCGWRNIDGVEKYAGRSGRYTSSDAAVTTTNGAGSKNIQFIVTDSNGQVLLVLPGYWNSKDFRQELEFCLKLNEIANRDLPVNVRNDEFMLAHLNQAVKIAGEVSKNSKLQGFDENAERRKGGDSAFVKKTAKDQKKAGLKTVDQVVHEKMAEVPFIRLEDFDIGRFVDYGTRHYDKRVPGERRMTPGNSGAKGKMPRR
ncbi:MAG: hypothetical protein AAF488_14025 [Planctomycetota bacterium]